MTPCKEAVRVEWGLAVILQECAQGVAMVQQDRPLLVWATVTGATSDMEKGSARRLMLQRGRP